MRKFSARFKAEAEKVGYPATRITVLNFQEEWGVPARGSYELDAARDFYKYHYGQEFTECRKKSDAAFLMRDTCTCWGSERLKLSVPSPPKFFGGEA